MSHLLKEELDKKHPDYSCIGYMRRRKQGISGMDHDGGHRGNARDIREQKKIYQHQRRCKLKRELRQEELSNT